MRNLYLLTAFLLSAIASSLSPTSAQTVLQPAPVGIACAYNSTLPTLVTNNFGWVQCNSTGTLLTSSGTVPQASGSITTQNLNPGSGVPTAASFVPLTPAGLNFARIQVTGTYTGALTAQCSVDGANWISTGNADEFTNVFSGQKSSTIGSGVTGIWQVYIGGCTSWRLSANAAVTGTAVVTIQPTEAAVPGPDPSVRLTYSGQTGAVATGTTGAVAATIAAVSGRLNYLCGYHISALGTAGAVGPITITGLAGGTITIQSPVLAAGVLFDLSRTITPCQPGSGTNTAIVATTTADATATAVDVDLQGYTTP